MFKISNEQELLECFRPLERDEVLLPAELRLPLVVKDYLAWLEPSGARVYLVFNDRLGDPPLGIVFRRDQSTGSAHVGMCEWCHSVRGADDVGLLSATASSKRRIGLNLCRDLSCKAKVESTPGAHDFHEGTGTHERVRRIIGRMNDFARRELF